MFKIISVVGTRPNFVKIAPLYHELLKHATIISHKICHTGQHFDKNMSDIFFQELNMPSPDFFLGINGGSHAKQTAEILNKFEEILLKEKPDLIVVPGDVNSTMACALTASKLGIKVAHVEAGLRSFDRSMPEEINRIITDSISDYLFVSEPSGLKNLQREGVESNKVFYVGNIMIDSLVALLKQADESKITGILNLVDKEYSLVTFHRPSNVDGEEALMRLVDFLNTLAMKMKVVFPIHPRTFSNLQKFGLTDKLSPDVILSQPIGYIDFIKLIKEARFVVTDSGGIQEETTWLVVPCITVRTTTERPVTVDEGTNQLAGTNFTNVLYAVDKVINGASESKSKIPNLWDGKTAERIVSILLKELSFTSENLENIPV
jgi:UDP-N-acetylglucosamine 2-epimerase (non-hydrolysing)